MTFAGRAPNGRPGAPATILTAMAILAAGCGGGGGNAAPDARATEVVRAAVATNFAPVFEAVARAFEEETGVTVVESSGSTGMLYAQILQGAPFDVFLAADADRPRRLVEAGRAEPGSRFTYAVGRLSLWSPDPRTVDSGGAVLAEGRFERLAIANPDLAPYGRAARETLESLGLWARLAPRLVRGEDVGQAYHFVATRNAEIGFLALSQVLETDGSRWDVPPELYSPIEQQAVRLVGSPPTAARLLRYLAGAEARRLIRARGYGVGEGAT